MQIFSNNKMMSVKPSMAVLTLVVLMLTNCNHKQTTEIRNEYKKYYDQFNVEGSFVLYDPQAEKYVFYNPNQYEQTFSPASTFKICNTLIGLETGVIKDKHFVIQWDSVLRNPVWDKDHDLKTAFEHSTVWYYQELARRVGGERMKYWLDKVSYGNADTSGGIDRFWLTGGLRISPKQQIEFLKQLHNNQLPFSQRSVNILKEIMITKDTLGYVIRAKKGWGNLGKNDVGWYVGYLEKNGNVYYFSNCVQTESEKLNDINRAIGFDKARSAIVFKILDELKLTRK
jgi:beta-lactamase class D